MNHILKNLNNSDISAEELTKGHDLDDLIDRKTERLGGVVFKEVDLSLNIDKLLGNRRYADEPLFFIGIKGLTNDPVGIIYFHSGDKPRIINKKTLSLYKTSFSPI